MFTDSETSIILSAKQTIRTNLQEFNMTIGKFGKSNKSAYYVSGGCFASLLQGELPKDYDIYFYSKELAEPIINIFTKDPSYMNEVEDVSDKYRDVAGANGKWITENAVTLKNHLQLITKHYGSPEEVRRTFDFVHCMPYYSPWDDVLYISRKQFNCCFNKVLEVNNSDNFTTWREQKFKERGYEYGKFSDTTLA